MEKKTGIKVSLIIATYNRAQVLAGTLTVLLEQTLPRKLWEVVVVDNNSPDSTRATAEEFAAAHPEINMRVVTERAQGVSHARNRGLAESVGEYIVVIDDDEDAVPCLLQQYLDLFESNPDVMAAGGRIIPRYESRPPKWLSPRTERAIAGTVDFGRRIVPIPRGKFFGGGNHGVRRTMFERYGGYNTTLGRTGKELLGGEEKELYFRFKATGAKIYYLPEAIIYHHIEPERLTEEYFRRLCRRIGRSEKLRTLGMSGSSAHSGDKEMAVVPDTSAAGDCAEAAGGDLKGVGNSAKGSGIIKTSRSKYAKRLFMEAVKWGGALTLATGYLLRMQPSKSRFLIIMRWEITRGLLSII